MLEGGHCRETESLLELLNELPAIEGIKKVDISGASAEYLYRKLRAVLHIYLCGLLIGVTAILEFKFFHFAPLLKIFVNYSCFGLACRDVYVSYEERDLVILVEIGPDEICERVYIHVGKLKSLRLALK